MLKVLSGQEIDSSKWRKFVLSHSNGNIFQTWEIYELYSRARNYKPITLCAVNEHDEILGTLLVVIQKELSGILGYFTSRAIVFGGPLIKDNDPTVLNLILSEYKKVIRGEAIYTQFRNLWDFGSQKQIFKENGFKFEDHLDILVNITKTESELREDLSRDRKKSINKGTKYLTVKLIDGKQYIDEIYRLLNLVYHRIRLPLPRKEFFIQAMDEFYDNGMLKVFAAHMNNDIVGVRLVLCYKEIVYDWYAGADDRFLEFRPNDILPWNIFLWGKNNGFSVFDFGGAGKPNIPYGVRDYKLKFGGELVDFGRFEMIHKPVVFKIAKFGLSIYKKLYGLF